MHPARFADNPLRTKADLAQLLRDLVEPLAPHFSAGAAQVKLGENRALYGDPAGWLEAFARPLWGLVPLVAGGGTFPMADLWKKGLSSGSDPAHPEYWGLPGNYDQRSVEQAAFGLALALAPGEFFETLAPDAQQRLSKWLQRINEVDLVQSNWLFFRIIVNLGLRRCGQPWSQARLDADLAKIDEFYLGNGWYSDGANSTNRRDGRTGDYYVPMAFHFYGLIYARLASADDPVRSARFVERARLFAADFIHYFAADGSALPFGRSLTYRFAQGAFWGALAFAAVEVFPWPVIKGLYLRHLRWWMQQPIFTETGLLTIGYTYPNLFMAESYNSSGSPYWALKAFIPLALPDSHPFWSAEEAPLPPRRAIHTAPGANLILTTTPVARDVVALSPGQPVLDWPRNAPHKYSKTTYSTRFGFGVPCGAATLTEGGLDNGLSLSLEGRFFRVRECCLDTSVSDGVAYSRWQPWTGVELQSWILAEPNGHIRIHKLTTAQPLWTAEGGFPVGFTAHATVKMQPRDSQGPTVRTPRGSSHLRDLSGTRSAECVHLSTNGSLLTSLSAMPMLRSAHQPGTWWLATWVAGNARADADFSDAKRFRVELTAPDIRLFSDDTLWWKLTGDASSSWSSPARLEAHASLV